MIGKRLTGIILSIILSFHGTVFSQAIRPSGEANSISHKVESFSALQLNNSATVVLIKANGSGTIKIVGDKNFTSQIACEIKNNTLIVKNSNDVWFDLQKPLMVYIPVVNLNVITNTGSGHILCEDMDLVEKDLSITSGGSGSINLRIRSKSLSIKKYGSSSISLSGASDKIDVDSKGSGVVDASALLTESGSVTSSGSVLIKANCRDSIVVDLRASSSLFVIGNPVIKKAKNSKGAIYRNKE